MTTTTAAGLADDTAPGQRIRPTVCLVVTASFLVFADISILTLIAPLIQRSLHASVSELELAVAGYEVAYAVTLIPSGRLGDIFGRRTMFTIGMLSFAAASAACGLARSPGQLIAFRVAQGFAGALLTPQVIATIQIVVPRQRRAGAFAALGTALCLSSILGPLFAGLLVSANIGDYGWRLVFLINVPICLVAATFAQRLVPAYRSPEAERVDYTGTLLVVALIGALLVPLTLGQVSGWPLWSVLCPAAVPVLGLLFLWSQRREKARGRDPLLPPGLWDDRGFRLGLVLNALLFSGIVAFYLYYALVLESGYHLSALTTAITTLPSSGAALVVSAISASLVRRWGGRRVVAAGAIVSSLGFLSVLVPVIEVKNATFGAWTAPSQLVFGTGLGLVVAPVLSVVLESIRSAEAGAASGLLSTAQAIASATGVVIMGTLFQTQIPGQLAAATAGQLGDGFGWALVFNPSVFALAGVILVLLPKAGVPDGAGHRKDDS
jgi:EmrB/QacA subfamily drug resistance transporter